MPSNQTTNYQLSQWVKSDQVKMEDFNADNAKIDAAIKAEADALAALAAKVPSSHLSCYTTSYAGSTDIAGGRSKSYSFPGKPWLVLVINRYGYGFLAVRNSPYGCTLMPTSSGGTYLLTASWSEYSVSLTTIAGDLNVSGNNYWLFALLES